MKYCSVRRASSHHCRLLVQPSSLKVAPLSVILHTMMKGARGVIALSPVPVLISHMARSTLDEPAPAA